MKWKRDIYMVHASFILNLFCPHPGLHVTSFQVICYQTPSVVVMTYNNSYFIGSVSLLRVQLFGYFQKMVSAMCLMVRLDNWPFGMTVSEWIISAPCYFSSSCWLGQPFCGNPRGKGEGKKEGVGA